MFESSYNYRIAILVVIDKLKEQLTEKSP